MIRRLQGVLVSKKRWPIRLSIFIGVLVVVLLGSSGRHLSARLDSPVPLPEVAPFVMFEGSCQMPGAEELEMATSVGAVAERDGDVLGGDIAPTRYVMDPYPTFNGIAVDGESGKVLTSDTNRKSLLLYDRRTNSRSGEETAPEKQIMGPDTLLGYIAGVAMDAERREVYTVNNDIEDSLSVFSYDDEGNLKPRRALAVPHQAWGVALSRARDELALTIEIPNAVVIYRREASGLEAPVRSIHGANTGLADPHGVSWDQTNKELVIANHGHRSPRYDPIPDGGGKTLAPSISVYPETAHGDVKSLRTIQGPRTQLAWPMGVDVDAERNEIVVANNADNSVLVFSRTASGDAAPVRVIHGPRTGIDRPMGVAVDRKNNELWVANFGNHSAVVFARGGNGNIAPKRVIRNAPTGTPTGGFGNPMAAAFDMKRDQILVPN
jgi:DNA-binding beta-propeller fold protein YncE